MDATEGGKKVRKGARLWTVATATFKSETYRFLRLDRPTDEEREARGSPGGAGCSPRSFKSGTPRGPEARYPAGTVHLPAWADAEWCKQLVAEQLVTVKTRRGFSKLEWQKVRERNEALDCRVYARAAAWILGADRWAEAKWRDLEEQVGGSDRPSGESCQPSAVSGQLPAGQEEAPSTAGIVRRPVRRGRKVFQSSYLG